MEFKWKQKIKKKKWSLYKLKKKQFEVKISLEILQIIPNIRLGIIGGN